MAVEWSYAGLVGVVGFGMVFAILVILFFFIWLTRKVLLKMNVDKPATPNEKEPSRPPTN